MFLFVFAIVYGLLVISKIFNDVPGANGIYALIALVAGLFVLVSKDTFRIIGTMTPWFTVLIIFLFLIFFVVKMFSGPNNKIFEEMLKSGPLKWVLIVIFILILIISLSSTFGQHMLEEGQGISSQNGVGQTGSTMTAGYTDQQITSGDVVVVDETGTVVNPSTTQTGTTGESSPVASEDFSSNVLATFTHPKILGMILIFVIGFFSILLLTQSND
jgi:hypothetical protein